MAYTKLSTLALDIRQTNIHKIQLEDYHPVYVNQKDVSIIAEMISSTYSDNSLQVLK